MTQVAQKLLDEFDALKDSDRSEVIAELLRRATLSSYDPPSDEDLTAAADGLFVELDRRWAEHLKHPESATPWCEVRRKLLG